MELWVPPKPYPYIDTNVILDFVRKRDDDSVQLIQTLRRKKMLFCTSGFTLLELIYAGQQDAWIRKRLNVFKDSFEDILRRRSNQDLSKVELAEVAEQVYSRFLKPFVDEEKLVRIVYPSSGGWNQVIKLLYENNITIGDAFAVSAAQDDGCDTFITKDEALKRIVGSVTKMVVGAPIDINKKMKEKGVPPIWE
jgi:predicted nucleic acid-binding protein